MSLKNTPASAFKNINIQRSLERRKEESLALLKNTTPSAVQNEKHQNINNFKSLSIKSKNIEENLVSLKYTTAFAARNINIQGRF